MEQAAAGARTGTRWETSSMIKQGVAAAVAAAACLPATAQDSATPLDTMAEALRAEAPMRMEVNASALPRLQPDDTGFHAPRVDLSLLSAGRSGMGVAVGMSGFQPRSTLQPMLAPARPSFDLGVHWRHTFDSERQLDITAWRRMTPPPDALTLIQQREPMVYAARVELKLNAPRKSGLAAAAGFIGMQLESGARISIKRKDGRPMIYYRTAF